MILHVKTRACSNRPLQAPLQGMLGYHSLFHPGSAFNLASELGTLKGLIINGALIGFERVLKVIKHCIGFMASVKSITT